MHPNGTTPVYSIEEAKRLRLETCKRCTYAKCNGNESNKCNVSTLVCTMNDNKSIMQLTADIQNKCPLNYWAFTNATRPAIAYRPSCGCGK